MPAAVRRLVLPAAVLAALILPGSALAACPGAGAAASAPQAPAATLCLINAQRAAHGLAALASDARLQAAAQGFAAAMVAGRFFDHRSPDGGTLLDRIKAAGWPPASGAWSAGENIAWGSGALGTPVQIVDSWMHSPGHRANILRASYAQIGVGIAPGAPQAGASGPAGTYVTDFGTRSGGATSRAPAAAPDPVAKPAKRPATCARAAKRSKPAIQRCARR